MFPPNYIGSGNDNYMMNPNQNFQPMNQQSNPNMYNPNMMGYSGMMKQGGGDMQKTNEGMGYGPNQSMALTQ